MKRTTFITEEEIDCRRTTNGGFTKRVLAAWNVPWPPPQGWKKWILEYGLPYDGIEDLHREMDKECDQARNCDREYRRER